MLDRVKAAGFSVAAPTLPGHGTTPRDLQSRTFDEWVSHAREELAAFRAEHDEVVVCGFSMGSLVALALASDEATRKDVSGLVLLGCALRLAPGLRAAFRVAQVTKVRLPDLYLARPFGPDIRDKTLAAMIGGYERHPIRAAMEVYRAGQRLRPRLSQITCPTLALHGERDRVCSVEASHELVSLLGTRDVRVRTYAKSAHMLALDHDREEVARDVIAFLERRL